MASQYFAILTDYGTRAFAQALSQGQPLQLTQFAVGDGNGQAVTPTASATALVHQTHIAPVSAVSLDPRNNKQVIVELTIPENIGGFYIREMGVFDAQNKLIAYANCPESFKPAENSGSGKVQVLRMILKVESSSAVTLSIDHSVIFVTRQQMAPKTITATTQNGFDESGHTHEIAKASITQQGIVQLTNDTGLESESLALTAKAGKKLAQQTAQLQLNVSQNYIQNSKKSSAVNSESEDNVATSKAAKTAYDKAVEAKTAADNAQRTANSKQSPATTLAGYGIGNFKIEPFVGNLNTLKTDGVYAITQASRSQNLPVSTSCHIQVIAGGDGSWCRQLAYVAYSTDMYERHQTSYQTDSWSAWVKIDSLDKIPNSKKSSAVNSESEDNVATSKAAKTAYDKAIAAEELANTKWTAKSATESVAGILPISHKTDGTDKNKFASEYAVGEAAKKGLPLGAVVSFPRAVTNPVGFLKADGSTFNQQTFPDLYRTLGDSNQLPDLTRSDVGMTAYFAVDNIPAGWIAFDSIRTTVTQQNYPELYRHLVGKYGSISNVPLAEDRFIRNTGNGLNIGQTQSDEIKKHVHRVRTHWADSSDSSIFYDKTKTVIDSRLRTATTTDDNLSDNGFMHPLLDTPMATGGDETRPKSLILKLCIKAKNTFDDVQFWVKAFGVVENVGALDAGTLAQNMQALSESVEQKIEENKQYTLREINNAKSDINEQFLQAKESLSQISTLKTVWQGNVSSGSINISEKCFGKTLILYLQSSSDHSLDDNNNIELVSFEVGAEIEGKSGGGVYLSATHDVTPHYSGGSRLYGVGVKKFAVYVGRDGTTIEIEDLSNYFVKRIDIR
ncbi:tail fiber protein [Haemophilus influenzae]|uniref:phage tail-collar fiber domain-containing protein n=2 Tax=Haemophilus influenzae TaxID=727 RepID=UPI000766DCD6|nr:phage tail protein [Haemophilus influenzae]CWX41411.1 tail fiber protein [Haemophilus influenzae]CWX57402.1 tail fiber protein [Haemophilus influenzae]SQG36525.1 tail fiber protein [Haemophilus influenzae]